MSNSVDNSFDVIIVGAGPAGCACALALKDSGLKILLIDKSDFPRDKICGDAIGSRVKRVLKIIDPELETDFEKFPEINISKGWKLVSPKNISSTVMFVNTGFVSRRIEFDNWLFSKIKDIPEITAVTGMEVSGFSYENGRAVVQTNNKKTYHSKIVIACDGAQSAIVRSTRNHSVDHRHHSAAVRAYFENVSGTDTQIIEIHLPEKYLPGYFWIFPLNDSICNVGFGMLSSDIRKRKIDLKKVASEIISDSSDLSARFQKSKQLSGFTGFGLPLGGRKMNISGDGFMLCGDAASLIDPLNGEGIGNAMLSAYYAAQQVKKCFESDNFTGHFMSQYDASIHKMLLPELKKKLFFQRLFNRPWLINLLVYAASKSDFIKNYIGRKL